MLKRIKNTNILVHNYNEAVDFYTQKFGFESYQNFPEQNWVAVIVPGNKEHIITFCIANKDEDKALVGKQCGSYVLFILEVDDVEKIYGEWKEKGVEFDGEIQHYGNNRFLVAKDLYGNKLFVSDSKFFQ